MERHTRDKIWLTSAKILATVIVAIFVSGMADLKNKIKTRWDKREFIVEIIHTPKYDDRKIFIIAHLVDIDMQYSSFIQVDGEDCAVIHTKSWRDVPRVGNMVLIVIFENAQGKITDRIEKTLILGPPPDQMGGK
jgi:hypothetical protein